MLQTNLSGVLKNVSNGRRFEFQLLVEAALWQLRCLQLHENSSATSRTVLL